MKNEIVKTSEAFLKGLTDKQRRGLIKLTHLEYMPDTQAELARALGITERGLYNWWNTPSWCQAVTELIKKSRIKYLPSIENALLRKAKEGSYPHQKGFYSLIGESLEKSQTNVQVNSQVNVAFLNEHRERIKAIADQFSQDMVDKELKELNKPDEHEVIDGQIEGDFSDQAQGENKE